MNLKNGLNKRKGPGNSPVFYAPLRYDEMDAFLFPLFAHYMSEIVINIGLNIEI